MYTYINIYTFFFIHLYNMLICVPRGGGEDKDQGGAPRAGLESEGERFDNKAAGIGE